MARMRKACSAAGGLEARFIGVLMRAGTRRRSERILRGAVALAHRRLRGSVKSAIVSEAIRNVRPDVEVKRRRVGGTTYVLPVPVRGQRGEALAIRWLVEEARAARGRSFAAKLAAVLVKACEGRP